MSTKSEINISTIWVIFKTEIVAEAPAEKLILKSRREEGWKDGSMFFSFLWEDQKGANWISIPFLVGEKVCWPLCNCRGVKLQILQKKLSRLLIIFPWFNFLISLTIRHKRVADFGHWGACVCVNLIKKENLWQKSLMIQKLM